ncbi:MAG: hypothetical protein U0Q22_14100 [Acidimicrobiales bacterium]
MTSEDVPHYEIRVRGRLGSGWAAWFDGLDIESGTDGTTVIRGPVVDQAALHGVLQRLRDVGLVLESLAQVEAPRPVPTTNPVPTNPAGATS